MAKRLRCRVRLHAAQSLQQDHCGRWPVIVIEGLFALYDADLRDMMSLKIFVDTASDVRFIRRMQRDITERGRSGKRHRAVSGNSAPDAQAIHRADQAQCRCHLAAWRQWPQVDMITAKVASRHRPIETGLIPACACRAHAQAGSRFRCGPFCTWPVRRIPLGRQRTFPMGKSASWWRA